MFMNATVWKSMVWMCLVAVHLVWHVMHAWRACEHASVLWCSVAGMCACSALPLFGACPDFGVPKVPKTKWRITRHWSDLATQDLRDSTPDYLKKHLKKVWKLTKKKVLPYVEYILSASSFHSIRVGVRLWTHCVFLCLLPVFWLTFRGYRRRR